jgi:sugar-specific transcriptional regulator TrmB
MKNLGFSETEVKIYMFLIAVGPKEALKIAEALELHMVATYKTLKKLQNKGLVMPSKHATIFCAEPFEKVLDFLNKDISKQKQSLEDEKEKLLSIWRSITKKNNSI